MKEKIKPTPYAVQRGYDVVAACDFDPDVTRLFGVDCYEDGYGAGFSKGYIWGAVVAAVAMDVTSDNSIIYAVYKLAKRKVKEIIDNLKQKEKEDVK